MDKVAEYQLKAAACRREAVRAPSGGVREHYLELANMWAQLAEERLLFLQLREPPPDYES